MRHVLLLGVIAAIATGALGMGQTPPPARLVAPARCALAMTPGLPRAVAGAIDLAAIAAAADEHLRLAADT